jgi:hypothetical protein
VGVDSDIGAQIREQGRCIHAGADLPFGLWSRLGDGFRAIDD